MASNEGVDTTVIAKGDKIAESDGRVELSESGRRVTRDLMWHGNSRFEAAPSDLERDKSGRGYRTSVSLDFVIAKGDKIAESDGRVELSESGRRVTRARTRGGRIETCGTATRGSKRRPPISNATRAVADTERRSRWTSTQVRASTAKEAYD
jgi:hypothetical protein